MFGSYGSYSSMCARAVTPATAIDIGTTRSSSTCAFPSWPRRSSLSSDDYSSASSYLSDEDLFLSDSFDDDISSSTASSRSNSNASSISPPHNLHRGHYQPQPPQDHFNHHFQQNFQQPQERVVSEEELLQLQRERQAYQRDITRALVAEKERRKQAAAVVRRQQRRAAAAAGGQSSSSASRKKSGKLAAIAETGVEES
ncbi:hypothetical protein CMQ_908 [Grosmannia clavigera kw1407]|uniref:Uncharacterized protein n=1 Tax=Grosmannia clavigera (strain kw1407 / UAMH 11150) TaxID=655863 RepID=F0XDE7_GROCL|nr:uncharacterized protein CMQ_908 [Grosmannia clavigera kw1407]EFX03980.1 hypothetical protein CMQ_908 [Grosmannia clavigera kw1407]